MLKSLTIKAFILFCLLIINSLSTKAIPVFQQPDTTTVSSDTSKTVTKASNNPLEFPVYRNADDSIKAVLSEQKVYLYGNAVVKYDKIELTADLIIYDMKNSLVLATYTLDSNGNKVGKPVFKEGTEEIESDTIKYNFETKRGIIKQVRTKVAEGYIDGELVVKDENDILYIKDGRYCPCEDPDAHTKFRVTKIKVMEDLIVTGPGYLELAGIPTPIMFPFGFFPNKKERNAGIIVPTFGESPTLGFFLNKGGFYWPVNDYMDMQILGEIYSRGSWGLQTINRYNNRYKYDGNLDISYNKFKTSDPEFPDYTESTNFWVKWRHAQDPKAHPYNRFTASVNAGSVNNFRNSFNTSTQDYLSNQFNSNINYTRIFPGKPFSLSLGASHNQNTQTGLVTVVLPSMSFNVNRVTPFKWYNQDGSKRSALQKQLEKIGLTYRLEGINRAVMQDTLLSLNNMDYIGGQMQNGFKNTMNLSSPWRIWKKRVTFNMNASYVGRYYFDRLVKTYNPDSGVVYTDTINRFSYNDNFSVGGGLTTKLYGYYKMTGPKGRMFRHMLTPNVSFAYRPDFSSQIEEVYQDTVRAIYSPFDAGIYGKAPAGESGMLSFNIINSLDMKVNSKVDSSGEASKFKIIENLNVAGGYDFIADSLNLSDIRVNARTTLFKNLRLNYTSTFDPYWYDALGNKRNIFSLNQTGRLARLKDASLATGFRIQSKKKSKETQFSEEEEDDLISQNQDPFDYFDVPWSLSVNYTIRYNRRFYQEFDELGDATSAKDSVFYAQTLSFNGDFKLTPKWTIAVNSGFDFIAKDFSYTVVNIERDLNCWVARFTWVPLGPRRSYSLTIALKNPLLRDVKYTRQRSWYDQEFF